MPEKKVLQRPSSATAHHVNGIVPDDALPPPPPAPAAAAMEEARQRRRSPPTSPRHAQTPTRASREGGHILSRHSNIIQLLASNNPEQPPRTPFISRRASFSQSLGELTSAASMRSATPSGIRGDVHARLVANTRIKM